MFVEKFIVNPRHIEIQVLGDKHGNVIHLGERECSIQRRNQKVVEEAPSPLLDEATRRAMGEQAVALAQAVGYDSAGTVEFVVGQDRRFYFLEMNTRLQVEHPVTELVTGVDLVEEMIRSRFWPAARHPERREDDRLGGREPRLRRGSDPPLSALDRPPGEIPPARRGRCGGVTVRNDTGVYEGGEISIHYDPMIAKLVTHAGNRLAAIDAQARALDSFVIDGVRHNVPFLPALMQSERWRAGRLSTGFIAEEFPDGFSPLLPSGAKPAHVLAAIAAHVDHVQNVRKRTISGQLRAAASFRFEPRRAVMLGKQRYDFEIVGGGAELDIVLAEGRQLRIASRWTPGEPVWAGAIDGATLAAQVRPILNGFLLAHRGVSVEARVYTRREADLAALMLERTGADVAKALLCPMPGLVKAISVRVDQEVKAGEALCMVEAMKMENVLLAERDVRIKRILAKEGDSLAVDAVIMEFA